MEFELFPKESVNLQTHSNVNALEHEESSHNKNTNMVSEERCIGRSKQGILSTHDNENDVNNTHDQDNSSVSEQSNTSGDSENIHVNYSTKSSLGSRVYDKRHVCYFCNKFVGKVTRHLEIMHQNEVEVAKLLVQKPSARKDGFFCLLRAGDYYHNCEVLSTKKELEWQNRISSAAIRTLRDKKMNATLLLPVTDDIMKLNTYLDERINESTNNLNLELIPENLATLACVLLSRIILFNKRRSDLEISLVNRLTIVEVPGKVPILLTPNMKQAIDKLIKTRHLVNIYINNPFVFTRGHKSLGYLRGHDCLRKCCSELDLKEPRLIRSTKLRKHDIRIHREFYRLHKSAVEITKISRLLLAVDKGNVNKFAGKSLSEIIIQELPDIDMSDSETEEESITNE
ncbi:hypothetical protein NQ314_000305 [Rhamnusium bicolor]|uniref:Uncharacterized protein n=1 Tax=Rhamnusium bicolor TaxID=1586634 RepID=A0AAV8ZUY8_9CUCU|nr:hypothetical protein NQ314_000305 [Rhamnusium bicolor]